MSSSQSREVLFPSISQSSCLPELLSVIRLSFDSEKIKEAERILFRREEDFRSQVTELKKEVEVLQKEHDSLVLTKLEKISLEKDFERCEAERKELTERVNRLIEERGSSIDSKIQAEEGCMNAMEACKRMESEGRKGMEELTWKNEKLKEEILRHRDQNLQKEAETGKVLITQPIKRSLGLYKSTSSSSDEQLAKRIRIDESQYNRRVEEVSEPSLEQMMTPKMIIFPRDMGALKVRPHSHHYIKKAAVQSIPHFISRQIIQEQGMELTLVPYYARLMQWNWGRLLAQPEYYAVDDLIREFFCNACYSPYKTEDLIYCRGCLVSISPERINQYLGTESIPREQDPMAQLHDRGVEVQKEILDALALPGTVWPILNQGKPNQLLGQFMEDNYRTTSMKVLHRWIAKTLVPSAIPSMVTVDSALVSYCIHMDRKFDVGRLIFDGIRRMARAPKKKVLGFPHLITALCRQANVYIDEATGPKQPSKPAVGLGCGAGQEDPQEDQAPAVPQASEPPKPAVEVSEPSLELTTTPEVIILPSTEGPLKVHPHSDHYITKEAVQSIPHFSNKEIIQEEGMKPTLVPYYARLMQWNWGRLLEQPEHYAVEHLIREFFCNARHSPYKAEASVYCRGCVVPISPLKINQYLGTASIPREQDPLVQLQDRGIEVREEILDVLALPGTVWPIHNGQHNQLLGQFTESSYRTTSMKDLHRWVTKTLVPSGDPSMVSVHNALVCYCIHMDRRFDVGRLIYAGIRRMARGPKKKVLGFPHLITSLCRRVNVCMDEAMGLKQPPKPAFGMVCGAAQEDQEPALPPASEPPKPAVGMGCGAAEEVPQEDQAPVVPPAPEPPKPAVGMGCGVAQEDPQEDQAPAVPLAPGLGSSAAPDLAEPPASDVPTKYPPT